MNQFFKTCLLVVLTMCLGTAAMAQANNGQRPSREQFAQKQAKYIAQNVPLNEDLTAKFVETFMRYQREVWALGPRPAAAHKKQAERSDSDREKAMQDRFARSEHMLQIRKKYYDEYRKFLTPAQIERVYELEKQSINRMADHRKNHHKNRQR